MTGQRPLSAMSIAFQEPEPSLPEIDDDDRFADVVRKLSFYFVDAVQTPHTFEELRTLPAGRTLVPLIRHLADYVTYRSIVSALLALKSHFVALESEDDRGINEARGHACEIVAWRFVTSLSSRECIDYLLFDLPADNSEESNLGDAEAGISREQANGSHRRTATSERTPLLSGAPLRRSRNSYQGSLVNFGTDRPGTGTVVADQSNDLASDFANLNALEIATVCGAKKFLSQRVIQKIVGDIWRGDIIFWETLSVYSEKKAKIYNKKKIDPFCRLRVPRYLKIYEVLFFATFLALYYIVLVQKSYWSVTAAEVLLYIYIAGFAYDEFGEFRDAGTIFYAADFWSVWDLLIVAVGLAFLVARITGLAQNSFRVIDTSFDILALEALFLVPRICSLLSLNPYFGTLIPCLKEMTKDFVKFLSLVVILYLGFLTTFTLLARGIFSPSDMSWILIKVFFGSSYLGFDVAAKISPILGPPVMLIFVCMTNILLITSLISLLSNSLTKILDHAREEYLFVYSVYVLEASTSNRLTYYFPPLNLLALIFRPFRLVFSSEQLRSGRIILLKGTHFPFVAAIWAYEKGADWVTAHRVGHVEQSMSLGGPEAISQATRSPAMPSLNSPRPLLAGQEEGVRTGRATTGDVGKRRSHQASSSASTDDLKSLVLKLAEQMEELTAMVAASQSKPRNGEEEAA